MIDIIFEFPIVCMTSTFYILLASIIPEWKSNTGLILFLKNSFLEINKILAIYDEYNKIYALFVLAIYDCVKTNHCKLFFFAH